MIGLLKEFCGAIFVLSEVAAPLEKYKMVFAGVELF
jgi:hypothetical protein